MGNMTNSTSSKDDTTTDLDTLIRQAELRVVAVDRDWQRHGDQLAVALRGHAGTASKVGLWGGMGLAVAAVGTGLLRWRSKARARAEAKTVAGRAKGLAQGLAKGVADKWAGFSSATTQAPVPPRRPTSRAWELVISTLGLLLGAAARTGLKGTASSRPGVAPLLFSVGLPMVSRWWRSQAHRSKPPESPR